MKTTLLALILLSDTLCAELPKSLKEGDSCSIVTTSGTLSGVFVRKDAEWVTVWEPTRLSTASVFQGRETSIRISTINSISKL